MTRKLTTLLTVCVSSLAISGCQDKPAVAPKAVVPTPPPVQSVAVDPSLGAYHYLHTGDTLQFTKVNPNAADFWVVFDPSDVCSPSPLQVTSSGPASCAISTSAKPGTYHYTLSPTKPAPIPSPAPVPVPIKPAPGPAPAVAPRKCPQCEFILVPPHPAPGNGVPTPPPSSGPNMLVSGLSAYPNAEPVPVTCNSATGIATAPEIAQYPKDTIYWYPVDGTDPSLLTVTVPKKVCHDENGQPQTLFHGYQPCRLVGKIQSETPYTIQTQGCTKAGTGSAVPHLTISSPLPTLTP
jgi:hypothetical protein